MNTKILLSFFSAILLSISAYAYTPETIVLSNIENTEKGCVKERVRSAHERSKCRRTDQETQRARKSPHWRTHKTQR